MNQREFARRRLQLMTMAGDGAIVLLRAAPLKVRNRDTTFPYRQSSDFYYLTGFTEPEAILALVPGRDQGEQILFCRDHDAKAEQWDGARLGLDGAVDVLGMDDAFPIGDCDDILPNLLEGRTRVVYSLGRDTSFDQQLLGWISRIRSEVKRGARAPGEFISLDPLLHEMRLKKNREEVRAMRKAARVSAEAHIRALRACKPGMTEYELCAELLHTFYAAGGTCAYEPIVGGGENACVLHYVRNRDVLKDGDLVLIDAGVELDHYASDISRTFPVNGRFSARQAELYSVVLQAQEEAIACIAPGIPWEEPHRRACATISQGLVDLGILAGPATDRVEDGTLLQYYPHKTGHWIGLDVHDVGDYQIDSQPRELEPGMVMTIEPGVYIPTGSECDPAWHGIGIRIEDDIVVTRDGYENLTDAAPKSIQAIEECMSA